MTNKQAFKEWYNGPKFGDSFIMSDHQWENLKDILEWAFNAGWEKAIDEVNKNVDEVIRKVIR